MKTAVSIPDKLFRLAEKTALRMKIHRSRLYAKALEEFIQRNKDESVTDKLNKIYSSEDSSLDPYIKNLQKKTLSRDDNLESW